VMRAGGSFLPLSCHRQLPPQRMLQGLPEERRPHARPNLSPLQSSRRCNLASYRSFPVLALPCFLLAVIYCLDCRGALRLS